MIFDLGIPSELKLSKIGRREIFFFNITDTNIESIIDIIKSNLSMSNHKLNVYPGEYGVNIVVELSDTNEEFIKQKDLELSAKVLEICEKRAIGVHLMKPIEIFEI